MGRNVEGNGKKKRGPGRRGEIWGGGGGIIDKSVEGAQQTVNARQTFARVSKNNVGRRDCGNLEQKSEIHLPVYLIEGKVSVTRVLNVNVQRVCIVCTVTESRVDRHANVPSPGEDKKGNVKEKRKEKKRKKID